MLQFLRVPHATGAAAPNDAGYPAVCRRHHAPTWPSDLCQHGVPKQLHRQAEMMLAMTHEWWHSHAAPHKVLLTHTEELIVPGLCCCTHAATTLELCAAYQLYRPNTRSCMWGPEWYFLAVYAILRSIPQAHARREIVAASPTTKRCKDRA